MTMCQFPELGFQFPKQCLTIRRGTTERIRAREAMVVEGEEEGGKKREDGSLA